MNKILHILSVFIIVFAIVSSSFGLFYTTNGESFDFVNQYGNIVKIYGDGIYKNDSFFAASIFKGTDCTILILAIPLMIIALIMDIKNNTLRTKIFLMTLITLFAYYSTSISIGVKYNVLHLIYITLFSCSFYALIIGFILIKNYDIKITVKMDTIGIKIFLVFCGLSLFIAWLPDIITSLVNNKSLELIEIYTTQITYVLDMGIVSPLIFICLFNLSRKKNIGYILLGIVLGMLIFVGIMVIIQSIFQTMAGIKFPIEVTLTKVVIFVLLGVVAIFYEIKLFKNISSGNVI